MLVMTMRNKRKDKTEEEHNTDLIQSKASSHPSMLYKCTK